MQMNTASAGIFRHVQLPPNVFSYFSRHVYPFKAAEYFIMLKQLCFLSVAKVHTLHAWFTLDSSDSGHFARDELGEEREPLGEGYWKSIASGPGKLQISWETLGQPYRMWKLQSCRKESIDHGNPNVYSLWQT